MSANSKGGSKFKFLARVLADPDLSTTAKLVVVTMLLRFHDARRDQCNPSLNAIGKAIGLSKRAVVPAVAELKTSGWLEIVTTKGGSQRNTNRYKFDFSRTAPVKTTSPLTGEEDCTGEEDFTGGVKRTSPEGCSTLPTNPVSPSPPKGGGEREDTSGRRAADAAPPREEGEAFSEFWRQYPKHVGELAARRAFREALATGTNPQAIIAGAMRYAAERTGKPDRYTAKPDNWLRDGRWKDEPSRHGANNGGERGRRGKSDDMIEECLRQAGIDLDGGGHE